MEKTVREAQDNEMDQIYLMGFDAWSEGSSKDEYLEKCRNSQKYKKGTWHVLSNSKDLLSSMIRHGRVSITLTEYTVPKYF